MLWGLQIYLSDRDHNVFGGTTIDLLYRFILDEVHDVCDHNSSMSSSFGTGFSFVPIDDVTSRKYTWVAWQLKSGLNLHESILC